MKRPTIHLTSVGILLFHMRNRRNTQRFNEIYWNKYGGKRRNYISPSRTPYHEYKWKVYGGIPYEERSVSRYV